MYEYEQFARVISNWGKNCFFQPVSGFGIDHCWRVMCRAVTVFETETAAFPKPTGTNHGFLVPDERFFLHQDNRQDLPLRPNWVRCNNNDERACLSAPFITSLISQSRGVHETLSVS